jgi:GT2 family glycosyltransferase
LWFLKEAFLSSQPSVSIIIPIYNGLHYLPGCLSSVNDELGTSGELGTTGEVIVVDNASTDGSADWVSHNYPSVILHRSLTNQGFAAACNQGAALASGDILVFLNQDTRVLPGWLAGLVAGLNGNHAAGLVTSRLLLMAQPEKIDLCGQDLHFTGLTFGRGVLRPADLFNKPARVAAVSGASFAIRRELWQELGGFDPLFFMYYEETDLSWRACLYGCDCLYIPASVAHHDHPLRVSLHSAYYSSRNRIVLLLKHWHWFTLFLLSPGLLLAELVDCVYQSMLGWRYLLARLRAYGWLLAHGPEILHSRRRVQALRKVPDSVLLARCTPYLRPAVLTGGLLGQVLLPLLNVPFALNYYFALALLRALPSDPHFLCMDLQPGSPVPAHDRAGALCSISPGSHSPDLACSTRSSSLPILPLRIAHRCCDPWAMMSAPSSPTIPLLPLDCRPMPSSTSPPDDGQPARLQAASAPRRDHRPRHRSLPGAR